MEISDKILITITALDLSGLSVVALLLLTGDKPVSSIVRDIIESILSNEKGD